MCLYEWDERTEMNGMNEPRRTFFGTLTATLLLVGSAIAGPIEDAKAAYDSGDYATALHIFQPLADQGDAEAQFGLATMYEKGRGVPEDLVRAHMLYDLSAMAWPQKTTRPEVLDEALRVFGQSPVRMMLLNMRTRADTVMARDRVASRMTRNEIQEAQKLADEWKRTPQSQ
jgi:hypothetical protein